ncbi:7-cyano-7-deazaguanine synthase QueC [Allorhodopirellula heiligendammensis]|uniref:7-cyano-7-deazaguanine synthase n=1 Tax=Allorhodopirellula heiligendammensis TaxID=2714739 RepID=A0A5C6BH12_9BACT|nr:7-cyano-7-deazaguanine synthase QueC [Allorhodopirellula heiligendammensis]TWU10791.1 7-cyano-7-deazaguanine synthase [Allorhodopirellula heiligendammensis]
MLDDTQANPDPDSAAVVLLSGGLDSSTCLAIALERGFQVHAISFRYGQRNVSELERASTLASSMGAVSHRIIDIDLAQLGGSALVDTSIAVPKSDRVEDIAADIPVTYVPARNTIFLSYALAVAETCQSTDIFIGVNALDYSGYPDCRPSFIAAFEVMARLATKAGVGAESGAAESHGGSRKLRIHTPLIDLTKAQIIAEGLRLGVDYSHTLSCYDPVQSNNSDGQPCGHCDACLLRAKGFAANGISDPAI